MSMRKSEIQDEEAELLGAIAALNLEGFSASRDDTGTVAAFTDPCEEQISPPIEAKKAKIKLVTSADSTGRMLFQSLHTAATATPAKTLSAISIVYPAPTMAKPISGHGKFQHTNKRPRDENLNQEQAENALHRFK